MIKRMVWVVMAGLMLTMGLAATGDEKVGWDQVPAAVQKVLSTLAKGAPIKAIEKEKENGEVFYEGEWEVDGHEAEAKVTADGDLVEMEEEIGADAVPARVKAAVAKEFGEGAKVEYEKVMIVVYEAEAKVNGGEKEILVLPTGKIIGREEEGDDDDDGEENEVEISLDQCPAAVKATILAQANGAQIKEVEKETKNGVTVYEAEWNEGDQEVEVKVAADGTLLKREVEEDDDDDDGDDDDDN